MHQGAVVNFIRELMEEIPPEKRDLRWITRNGDVPSIVSSAGKKYAEAANSLSTLFDPWDRYAVPAFPLHVLPGSVQQFVASESSIIGCDRVRWQ